MGKVKDLYFRIEELIKDLLDSGIHEHQLDKHVKDILDDNEYQFYIDNKQDLLDSFFEELSNKSENTDNIKKKINYAKSFSPHKVDYYKSRLDNIKESIDEIIMPKLFESNEDDELADYENDVARMISAQLEDSGVSVDSDNLGDALYDKMVFIHDCMNDKMDPMDCAVKILSDKNFRNLVADEEEIDEGFMSRLCENDNSYKDWLDYVYHQIETLLDYDIEEDYTHELLKKYDDELQEMYNTGESAPDAAQFIVDEEGDYEEDDEEDEEGYDDDIDEGFMSRLCEENMNEGCNCGGKKRKPTAVIRRPNQSKLHESSEPWYVQKGKLDKDEKQ